MKPVTRLGHSLLPILALTCVMTRAQVTYTGDVATVNNSTDQTLVQRLWMDSTLTQAAPIGTALWLVADTTGAGFPNSTVTDSQIQSIVNTTGTIKLIGIPDAVDGTLLGNQPGKYGRSGIDVPSSYATASIGLMLWNDVNGDHVIGDAGDTFGFYNFGVVPPDPTLQLAQYWVTGDVHADQFMIVPVPEPAQAAVAVGALCLCAVVVRRLRTAAAR